MEIASADLTGVLTDFYRGWSIEITMVHDQFQATCYSPQRERLSDRLLYTHQFQAWQVAHQLIDEFLAGQSLKQFLRDTYEAGQISFEAWQRLKQSVDESLYAVTVTNRKR